MPRDYTCSMTYSRRIVCNGLAATLGVSLFRNAWAQAARPAAAQAESLLRQALHAIRQRPGDAIRAIAFDAKYTRLAVGFESGTLLLTGLEAATPIEIAAHKMRIGNVQFGPTGDHVFTNSYFDDETRVWDAATGGPLHTIPKARGPVAATGIPGVSMVAGSSALYLYHQPTRRLSPPAVPAHSGGVTSLGYHRAGRVAAVGTASGTVDVWRLDGDDLRTEIWRSGTARPSRMGEWVVGTWFSRDGDRLWLVSSRGVEEWLVEPLERKTALELPFKWYGVPTVDDTSSFLAVVGTPDSTGGGSRSLAVISLTEGRLVSMRQNVGGVGAMSFLPGVRSLVLAYPGQLHRMDF